MLAVIAIDPQLLDAVVGGRKSAGMVQLDPKVYEGMAQIAQAVKGAGEQLAQAKVAVNQQNQQMMGEMMQRKMGKA